MRVLSKQNKNMHPIGHEAEKWIGKSVHLANAPAGCVWKLKRIENGKAHLVTPKTQRQRVALLSELYSTVDRRPKEPMEQTEPVEFEPVYTALPHNVTISDKNDRSTPCPTCTRSMYLRPRTLTIDKVTSLKEIARINIVYKRPAVVDDIESISKMLMNTNAKRRTMNATYTELKYWGMLEGVNVPILGKNGKMKDIQGWKITKAGIDFINKKIKVPETVWVFNDLTRENPRKKKEFVMVYEVKAGKTINRESAAKDSEKLDT